VPGIGVLVNISAIVVGSLIGLAVGRLIKESVRAGIIQVMGLAVIVIGVMSSITGLTGLSQESGILGRFSLVIFCLCLIIGTLIGEILSLETRLKVMGEGLQKRFQKGQKKDNTFVKGFMTASLVYCVGAMTVLGPIQDGLGNPDILLVKAVLDGTISIFFASTLGIGVLFSIVPLFILQGTLALLAFSVGDVVPLVAITGIEAVGGVLIAGIGINLALGTKLRIGNMLPSVFVALAVVWILAEVLPY